VIEVEVVSRDIAGAILRIRDRLAKGVEAYEGIGASLKDNIRLGFVDSTSPYGEKWLPLKHRVGQPLVDTGRLRDSITYRASNDGVEVGTNVVYAAIHQFGGMAGRKQAAHIPARPYMPVRENSVDLPDDWKTEVLTIVKSYIEASFH
jgi:phage virion morphogenesis protein